jgi:transcriptional regulator with AAA-type ATPase domain
MSEKKIGKTTWNKGLKEDKEHIEKRRINLIEYYKNNDAYFKNKEFSLEHKKRLSISNSKKCIDKITNIEYYGLKEACNVLNIDYNNQKYLLKKYSDKSRFKWVI